MRKAAQIEVAAGTPRMCKGHEGSLWVPIAAGNGRWQYHWLTSEQALFLNTRTEFEKYAILHGRRSGCFVCRLQKGVESEPRNGRNLSTGNSDPAAARRKYVAPVIELL